jgi:dynein heavy chain, axonemal
MFGGWADEWLNDLVALDVSGVVGPPYAVQSLHPAQGPVTGGTLVSIIGSDFVKPPEGVDVLVKFVGESGEEVVTGTYVNHGEVTCHAPSWEHHSSGSGEVL